ncbi:hypothetical protein ABT369_18215 [Dactylosporangium sp. NPDC000244]|uniref:hypothetical protein n=1 Tax=Dactylosporangium sp. NPDC000244 TaxID=3154365 RepID=UPI00332CA447
MAQMQLFSSRELAAMRDRTKARNCWPGKDEFRQEARRRRGWGLVRRHAEKLRRIHEPTEAAPAKPSADPVSNAERHTEVISARIAEVAVLEVGEDECCPDEFADSGLGRR